MVAIVGYFLYSCTWFLNRESYRWNCILNTNGMGGMQDDSLISIKLVTSLAVIPYLPVRLHVVPNCSWQTLLVPHIQMWPSNLLPSPLLETSSISILTLHSCIVHSSLMPSVYDCLWVGPSFTYIFRCDFLTFCPLWKIQASLKPHFTVVFWTEEKLMFNTPC